MRYSQLIIDTPETTRLLDKGAVPLGVVFYDGEIDGFIVITFALTPPEEVQAIGPRFRNCGASALQNQLASEQTQFYSTLTNAFNETFPEQQQILSALTSEFQPILEAGPNQEGFSPAEESAMRTEATDLTARGANQADVALNAKEAENGGGAFIPSGANTELEAGLLSSAANENSTLQSNITQANYATGRENFLTAAQELGGTAAEENPLGFAGAATGAGSAANTTEQDIAQENSAWMGPVFGLLGGLGSSVINNGGFSNVF